MKSKIFSKKFIGWVILYGITAVIVTGIVLLAYHYIKIDVVKTNIERKINTEANNNVQLLLKMNGNNTSTYLVAFDKGIGVIDTQIKMCGYLKGKDKDNMIQQIKINQRFVNMVSESALVNINRTIDGFVGQK